MKPIRLELIDGAILVVYFVFVLGLDCAQALHAFEYRFLSVGPLYSHLGAGLAFLSANLGAQEVIGMAASGANTES